MKYNLIQLWLLLDNVVRQSDTEGVVVMDFESYHSLRRKLDGMLREIGVSAVDRNQYVLDDDKRIRGSERNGEGECAVCGRRHVHMDHCETLKRRVSKTTVDYKAGFKAGQRKGLRTGREGG